jgi:hypothetical protein
MRDVVEKERRRNQKKRRKRRKTIGGAFKRSMTADREMEGEECRSMRGREDLRGHITSKEEEREREREREKKG